jgi:hypothetical protein
MDKPRSFAPILAGILLLLPVLYVASYLALVYRAPVMREDCSGPRRIITTGYYRWGGLYVERLFWPLEQVDRKVRPGVWREDPWFPSQAY